MNKFDSLEEFLDFLPSDERFLVEYLREIVLECLPQVKEKLSYNVPYYFGKRRICFIWPSSVPWGNVKNHGVQIGFCYGNLIEDTLGFLEKGNRKQVFSKTFLNPKDIDENILRQLLFKAHAVDQEF